MVFQKDIDDLNIELKHLESVLKSNKKYRKKEIYDILALILLFIFFTTLLILTYFFKDTGDMKIFLSIFLFTASLTVLTFIFLKIPNYRLENMRVKEVTKEIRLTKRKTKIKILKLKIEESNIAIKNHTLILG